MPSNSNKHSENELWRPCIVCGCDDYSYLMSPTESPGPIVRCNNCRFVYVNPIESSAALIADGPVLGNRSNHLLTSSDLADIDGSWEQPVIEKHLRELSAKEQNAKDALVHIEKYASQRGDLLDIGCFCGVFLNVAAKSGWNCYGIEPLIMPAIYARGKFGLQVITDILRDDTFPPNTFDVITAFQVFEHLPFPQQVLKIVSRILKPGGLVVIEVPNIDTLSIQLLGRRHRHFVQDHVSFFSPSTLSSFLESEGFHVREVYYPTRAMSLYHLTAWLARYNMKVGKRLRSMIPKSLLQNKIHVNFRDIIAVVAQAPAIDDGARN